MCNLFPYWFSVAYIKKQPDISYTLVVISLYPFTEWETQNEFILQLADKFGESSAEQISLI